MPSAVTDEADSTTIVRRTRSPRAVTNSGATSARPGRRAGREESGGGSS
jgi:hypothetical protein